MRMALALGLLLACARLAAAEGASSSPTEVVDRQLAAYNAKDLDAFLKLYAPDAELLEFPDKRLAKGTAALRERYTKRFADPILHATIAHRTGIGNKVIDHEKVRITWPEGPGTWELTAIYEVNGGFITRVWFIFGDKTVDPKK
jgi:hypothetical protein